MKKAIISVQDNLLPKVKPCLKEAGFRTIWVDDPRDGLNLLASGMFDLAVIEFAPERIYVDCIDKIRTISNAAILVLVSSDNYYDVEIFLEKADDAILSQFDSQELTVRAKALAKHPRAPWRNTHREENCQHYGELRIFHAKCVVARNRTPVKLTPTEYAILNLLASHPGQIFTQEQIYNAVHNDYNEVNVDKTVSNHISRLKKKLRKISKAEYIKVERAIGYHFEAY
ncbi:response regulator transcription factor [Ruminococcaceae bacterium OttesenSCG-928-D13]|nr:response regulator transcription factor [Ruminococcaceae bacterium OttesenSCG-928-D13]